MQKSKLVDNGNGETSHEWAQLSFFGSNNYVAKIQYLQTTSRQEESEEVFSREITKDTKI